MVMAVGHQVESHMQSSLQSHEDFDLLKLSGEVDLEYSYKVRQIILASLKSGNPLLIDLADVKYIDSSGVVSLLEGLQAAKTANLNYGLLNVSPPAMQVLTLTRLNQIFTFYNSVDQFQQKL